MLILNRLCPLACSSTVELFKRIFIYQHPEQSIVKFWCILWSNSNGVFSVVLLKILLKYLLHAIILLSQSVWFEFYVINFIVDKIVRLAVSAILRTSGICVEFRIRMFDTSISAISFEILPCETFVCKRRNKKM